ncbi:hypothetical protein N2152v2_008008 [Parachlorella kessleri]
MATVAAQQWASEAFDRSAAYVQDNRTASVIAGVGAVASITYLLTRKRRGYHSKPTSFELSGGSLDRAEVEDSVKGYYDAFSTLERGKGAQMARKEKVVDLVDKFYSLVTDLYEWGWGQSFHFSPKLPIRDWSGSEAAHEARIGAILGLAPGKTALDCGCGVGGPMRTIAAASGGNVTGITINGYQVKRATYHNEKVGLEKQCRVVQGNFLEMPFEPNSFDGAYAIEATCHAAKLEDVYGEIYRVLKPGATFVSYEWVTTKRFDGTNKDEQAIIDEIIIGNGLPEMRTWREAEQAGKSVGFKLVHSRDLAEDSKGANGPWYGRLTVMGKPVFMINAAIVSVLEFLRIAPKGMGQVHKMLVDTAFALIDGGEKGIFTPMHMLVFQKPE